MNAALEKKIFNQKKFSLSYRALRNDVQIYTAHSTLHSHGPRTILLFSAWLKCLIKTERSVQKQCVLIYFRNPESSQGQLPNTLGPLALYRERPYLPICFS